MIFTRVKETLDDGTHSLFEKLENKVGTKPALFIWTSVGITLIVLHIVLFAIVIVPLINNLINWLNINLQKL